MGLHGEKGFSLIELIIVVTVIGIMAAVSVPAILQWLPNVRLKAAARDLYSNMQTMRMLAIKTNKTTAIFFFPSNNNYKLCHDYNRTTYNCDRWGSTVDLTSYKSGVGYGHGSATKQANAAGSTFSGASADNVSYSFGNNIALFTPRGFAVSGGYVYFDNVNHDVSYAVGSLNSGAILLKKWQGSSWK